MEEQRTPKVGEHVVYHDTVGEPHEALITTVFGPQMVNVVYVSGDESRKDNYGRQIERASSCGHKDLVKVHGYYWRYPDEEPNPIAIPTEV